MIVLKNKITKHIIVFSAIIMALFSFTLKTNASVLNNNIFNAFNEIHYFADYDSLLGSDEPGQPLYYINIVLDVIKYAAMICLLGFSIADFIKAIVSSDKDALKKAGTTTFKRFIYCVMIFFLPLVINFLLDLFQLTGMIGVIC